MLSGIPTAFTNHRVIVTLLRRPSRTWCTTKAYPIFSQCNVSSSGAIPLPLSLACIAPTSTELFLFKGCTTMTIHGLHRTANTMVRGTARQTEHPQTGHQVMWLQTSSARHIHITRFHMAAPPMCIIRLRILLREFLMMDLSYPSCHYGEASAREMSSMIT